MLFIFDWDGTIIDSTAKIARCLGEAIADAGLPERSEAERRAIIGLGLDEAIRRLFPDIERQQLIELRAGYSKHFINADQLPCSFYPGVVETLNQLKSDGHLLAVATGKSRRGLDRVLANLDMQAFFHLTRCADETASKPHPLMLEQILAETGMAATEAVMIGDTEYDLEMAANIGMASIGVSYGAHSVDQLKRHQPQRIIDQFDQLLVWLAER